MKKKLAYFLISFGFLCFFLVGIAGRFTYVNSTPRSTDYYLCKIAGYISFVVLGFISVRYGIKLLNDKYEDLE